MLRGETNRARDFLGSDPDGAGTPDESEGIVADQVRGAFQGKDDGVVGVGTNGVELVGDTKDNARGGCGRRGAT